MKRSVWIVSEGSPGHISQSAGLVAALGEKLEIRTAVVETRPRFGGFLRRLVRWKMGAAGNPLSPAFMKNRLACEPPAGAPDLLVASGGKSVFAARSLAARHGVPLVFLGERKPYPSAWFHTDFTPSPFESGANDVQIEMIPTAVTRRAVEAAAGNWPEKPVGKLWAMIIGGASTSHHFTAKDWRGLAAAMNALAAEHGIRWLVTTSRRTGAEAESVLRQQLAPEFVAKAIWWSENPEKRVAAFLGAAIWVFVSQDSVTMVTEAVAAGRPTVVFRPESVTLKPTSFLRGYFDRLETARRIHRLPISGFQDFRPESVSLIPREIAVNAELADKLIERLGWKG